MALSFDITQTPPTADEITHERERLQRQLARSRARRNWLVMIILAIDVLLWLTWWHSDSPGLLVAAGAAAVLAAAFVVGDVAAIVGLVGVVVVGLVAAGAVASGPFAAGAAIVAAIVAALVAALVATVAYVMAGWHNASDALLTALARVDPAPKEACLDMAQWIAQDATVGAYRSAVISQGREILQGEHLAMKGWIETADTRQSAAEHQRQIEDACKTVYGMRIERHPILSAGGLKREDVKHWKLRRNHE